MSLKARIIDGSAIVEFSSHPEDSYALLTVSKERYDEDAVQIKLSKSVAGALGMLMLTGQEPQPCRVLSEDDKVAVVEGALYRLKERDYITPEQVRAIDDFMPGVGAEALADLYDLIRFHAGPE